MGPDAPRSAELETADNDVQMMGPSALAMLMEISEAANANADDDAEDGPLGARIPYRRFDNLVG